MNQMTNNVKYCGIISNKYLVYAWKVESILFVNVKFYGKKWSLFNIIWHYLLTLSLFNITFLKVFSLYPNESEFAIWTDSTTEYSGYPRIPKYL